MKKRIVVIGENPEELLEKYSPDVEVKPYIKFELKNKEQMWKNAVAFAEYSKFPETDIKKLKDMGPNTYWDSQTVGLLFDKNGNALTTENPDRLYDDYIVVCNDIPTHNGNKASCNIDEINFVDEDIAIVIRKKIDEKKINELYIGRFKDSNECVRYNSSIFYANDIVSGNGCLSYDRIGTTDIEWVCGFEETIRRISDECGSKKVTLYECE